MFSRACDLLFVVPFLLSVILSVDANEYDIGIGIADITGPAAEVSMMGYGKGDQKTSGIHFRLYSRAFIVGDSTGARIVYVNADVGMISQAVKIEVARRLSLKYKKLYTEANILLGSTHTHSGPGGYLQYILYIITSQGFVKQSFAAIVSGIIQSIERAHRNVKKGSIYYNEGELLDTSVNRSPFAYNENPKEERDNYPYDSDKEMQILKFVDVSGKPMGVISWFAVHSTSMNSTNVLISGDNKGYASYLFEKEMNPGYFPGHGEFVAAFANANEGDVSPNTQGPRCIDPKLVCDIESATCNLPQSTPPPKVSVKPKEKPFFPKDNIKCIAFGPGKTMFESTQMIGMRQYAKARLLFDGAEQKVTGPISFIHQHVDMTIVNVVLPNKTTVSTCKPALGYSFCAGTTDGPGAFDFSQGSHSSTPFWNIVRDFIKKPSVDQVKCHAPKPIILSTGEMKFPYLWQPTILPTQIIKIGNIAIAALPAEFTTMAGRRLRNDLSQIFNNGPGDQMKILLTGLANAYSSYVTTYEEYQRQAYEGASTIFGPNTLSAYIQQYKYLASSLMAKTAVPRGPDPPNLIARQLSFQTGVVTDGAPFGKKFGDVVINVEPKYKRGDYVYVSYISGHPKNDLQTGKSFLAVEKLDTETKKWTLVATDADWETKFFWKRTSGIFAQSQAVVIWDIPAEATPGTYRIRHFGKQKNLLQTVMSYVGISNNFEVI